MIHARVIMACAGALWAIQEEKLEEISAFLRLKLDGGAVSAEDLARITKGREREVAQQPGGVAVLPVHGTLAPRMNMFDDMSGGTSLTQLSNGFRAALADPAVKAIVFDHDSPGGTVAGTGELAEEIFQSRGVKPIVAQVNDLSASAAYWLASAADEIVVRPGAEAGGLGVYRLHEDISKMLEQKGIKPTIIRSEATPFKVESADIMPLNTEAAAHIQGRVNQAFDRFANAVAQYRGQSRVAVRDRFGQGRVFGAEELVSRGMADRIDTLEGTLERFGSGEFNPVANAARARQIARAEAADVLIAKWKAGEPPSTRELQEGLRGSLGLSKAEAENAVRLSFKGIAPGEPAQQPTEPAITTAHVADIRRDVDDLRSTLERLTAAL